MILWRVVERVLVGDDFRQIQKSECEGNSGAQQEVVCRNLLIYLAVATVGLIAQFSNADSPQVSQEDYRGFEYSNQVAVVDYLKGRVKGRIEAKKHQVADEVIDELANMFYVQIEEAFRVPVGRLLTSQDQILFRNAPTYSEFNPAFETTYWGGPSTQEIKDVLQPVYDILWRDFGRNSMRDRIVLYYGEPNPQISYCRKSLREPCSALPIHYIRLAAQGRDYQNYTYQFSHELVHLLTNYKDAHNRKFGWLSEMFAELGSAYILMSFALDSPYQPYVGSDWSLYFQLIYDGKDQALMNRYGVGKNESTNEWLTPSIIDILSITHTDRELNWGVARELLPLFLNEPELWSQVNEIYLWNDSRDDDLQDFLNSWERTLNTQRKPTTLIRTLKDMVPHTSRER